MLIGMGQKKEVAAVAQNSDIFSVTTAEFESRIIAESEKRPILIDFWASWCGPCKQLMPVLEQVITAQGGKVALAKVDIDASPELAQAFRVQSVPTVVAFYMGQPVAAFQGVRPKSEIENMVAQLLQMQKNQAPDALDIPAVLTEAASALNEKDFATAQNLYGEVLQQNPQEPQAIAGMIRIMTALKDIERASEWVDALPDNLKKDTYILSSVTALELAKSAPNDNWQALEQGLTDKPEDLYNFAEACFAAEEKEKAVETLISIMTKNRNWEDDKARKQLIKYFEAWGYSDPASISGRRKLSSLLFS